MHRTLNFVCVVFPARFFFILAAVHILSAIELHRTPFHLPSSNESQHILSFSSHGTRKLEIGSHTGSILAAADLDEGLDVGDFARHLGR